MTRPPLRKPRRLSVTVPFQLHQALIERSIQEGRSISNLASFLLETALAEFTDVNDSADNKAA